MSDLYTDFSNNKIDSLKNESISDGKNKSQVEYDNRVNDLFTPSTNNKEGNSVSHVSGANDIFSVEYAYLDESINKIKTLYDEPNSITNLEKSVAKLEKPSFFSSRAQYLDNLKKNINKISNPNANSYNKNYKTLLDDLKKLQTELMDNNSDYVLFSDYQRLKNLSDFADDNVSEIELQRKSEELALKFENEITKEIELLKKRDPILFEDEILSYYAYLRVTKNDIYDKEKEILFNLAEKYSKSLYDDSVRLTKEEVTYYKEKTSEYFKKKNDLIEKYRYKVDVVNELEFLDALEENERSDYSVYLQISKIEINGEINAIELHQKELEKAQKELDSFNELINSLKVNSNYSEDVILNPDGISNKEYIRKLSERIDELTKLCNSEADYYVELKSYLQYYIETDYDCNYISIMKIPADARTSEQNDYLLDREKYYVEKDLKNVNSKLDEFNEQFKDIERKLKIIEGNALREVSESTRNNGGLTFDEILKNNSEYQELLAMKEDILLQIEEYNYYVDYNYEEKAYIYKERSDFEKLNVSRIYDVVEYYDDKMGIYVIEYHDKNGNIIDATKEEIALYYINNDEELNTVNAYQKLSNGKTIKLANHDINECINSLCSINNTGDVVRLLLYLKNTGKESDYQYYYDYYRQIGDNLLKDKKIDETVNKMRESWIGQGLINLYINRSASDLGLNIRDEVKLKELIKELLEEQKGECAANNLISKVSEAHLGRQDIINYFEKCHKDLYYQVILESNIYYLKDGFVDRFMQGDFSRLPEYIEMLEKIQEANKYKSKEEYNQRVYSRLNSLLNVSNDFNLNDEQKEMIMHSLVEAAGIKDYSRYSYMDILNISGETALGLYKTFAPLNIYDGGGFKIYAYGDISQKEIDNIITSTNKLPENIRTYVGEVEVFDINAPTDAFSKERYGYDDAFHSAGRGGDGTVYLYNALSPKSTIYDRQEADLDSRYGTIVHEVGHNVDSSLSRYQELEGYHWWTGGSSEWEEAMIADKAISGLDSPTDYGKNNKQEDFAESFKYYYLYTEEFKENFPNRYEIIDNIFKTIPDNH